MHSWLLTLPLLTSSGVLLIAILLYRQFDQKLRDEIRRLDQRDWNKKKGVFVMKRNKSLLGLFLALAISLGVTASGSASAKDESKTQTKPAATIQDHISNVAGSYISIQAKLAKDSARDVNKDAKAILKSADAALILAKKDEKKNAKLIEALGHVKMSVEQLDKDKLTIGAARENFYALSVTTVELIKDHLPKKQADKYFVFYCPMAKGYWVQTDKKPLRNPYYGSEMLTCGKAVDYGKDYDRTKSKGYEKNKDNKIDDHQSHKH